MIGRHKMKSWRDALRYWQLNNMGFNHSESKGGRSVFELTKIIEAKRKVADELKNKYATETGLGIEWSSTIHRGEYIKLSKQIKELTAQLAAM